jgi:hypothetical protein
MVKLAVDKQSLRDLDRALVRYAKKRQKDVPDVANRAAMNVAFRAAQFTPKASKTDIKNGFNPYALVRWIYKTRGPIKNGPSTITSKSDLETAAAKLVAIRMASIAFIRAGWLPAAKTLQAIVKRGKGDITASRLRRGRVGFGYGKSAIGLVRPFALVVNQSVNPTNATSGAALEAYGGPAAAKAIRYVANDMLRFIREPFDAGALEFNRKR